MATKIDTRSILNNPANELKTWQEYENAIAPIFTTRLFAYTVLLERGLRMASELKLKTISALAKVSIGTASRVMRNKGYVSPEARERVLNALAELSNSKEISDPQLPKVGLGVGIIASSDEFIYEGAKHTMGGMDY